MNLLSKNNLKQIDWKINSAILNIYHDLFTLNWHYWNGSMADVQILIVLKMNEFVFKQVFAKRTKFLLAVIYG